MEERKHSGLGIAAFVMSIVVMVLMFIVFLIAGIWESTTPGGIDEESAGAVALGLGIFALIFIDLVAGGLAIAGLCQARKKLFSVLGLVFSLSTIVITVLLMIIGSMM